MKIRVCAGFQPDKIGDFSVERGEAFAMHSTVMHCKDPKMFCKLDIVRHKVCFIQIC